MTQSAVGSTRVSAFGDQNSGYWHLLFRQNSEPLWMNGCSR
jgi:hypothetical protein